MQISAFINGYAQMKDLKASGIHPRSIKKAVDRGSVEKVKPGLYKLVDFPWDENSSFVDICRSNKKAVICLTSAIEYYGLTTFNPDFVTFAIPMKVKANKMFYPPSKPYFFRDNVYRLGIETVSSNSGNFLIYSVEKTIVDLFRYRNKIGDDIFLEALKNYLSSSTREIASLLDFAGQCGVLPKIKPYLKALSQ